MIELKTTPYWWEAGVEPPAFAAEPPRQVDLAVIGGGFTGMSAALTAAEAGASVVLIDAMRPGMGASTRNGGMIGAPHRPGFVKEMKTYGQELGTRLMTEGIEAYEWTRSLYTRRGIDAGYQKTGRLQLAFTKAHFEALKARVALLNEIAPQGVQVLQRDELSQHIGSDLYFGAALYPDHGGIHPRRAHDGLMRLAARAGVTLVAECPVTAMRRDGDGFRLETAKGEVRARRLVVATNGYTSTMQRWLSRRIFRLPSFIIATEPLRHDVIDRVAPGRHMMVESRARHSYFRVSPDGTRILYGGRAALSDMDPVKAAEILKATMAEVWPEAARWRITHSWTGYTGFTFAGIPHVGERDGAHFAYGYCGNGVALSPWLGRKAAFRALGDPRGETAYAETRLETRPYHFGGWPWFMPIASLWWNRVIDRRENREAARDRAS